MVSQQQEYSMNMTGIRNMLLGSIACILVVACQPGTDKKQLKVGFSQVGAESAWRTANTKSMKSEAEKRGVDFKFSDAQGKQETQIQALRSFIAQDVDAIILSPVVETGWEPVLKEAKQANIPVILSDRRIKTKDDTLFTCFIGSDFVEEGRMAGRWLVKKMDGKANIVELLGTPGSAPMIDRRDGFTEVITNYPGMKVIASQSGMFRRSKGKEVMEAFMKQYGDQITALYAHNDDMAIGAIQAIEDAGKKPGKDIIVVSIDAVRGAFETMIEGKLNCTVECNPLLGPAVFDIIEKTLAGETVPKYSYVKDEVFEQSVAKDVIDSRQY
jgi:ABC-type sugar transport system substrate-binding protein